MSRLVPRITQNTRISPELIMRYELLRLPSQQLGPHLQELSYSNPLLEVIEHQICPRCGHELPPGAALCASCAQADSALDAEPRGNSGGDDEERAGWLESISEAETLYQALWRQCLELDLDEMGRRIACHLIADLDEHGYLATDPAEHAIDLGVTTQAVERVRQQLMRLDPLGIGARGPQECLLVQLELLGPREQWARVARRLIREQWETLMEGELRRAARAMKMAPDEVEEAFKQMLNQLYLYPTSSYRGQEQEQFYPQPDARFHLAGRGGARTVQVEIVEEQRYSVGIAPEYRELISARAQYDEETRNQIINWAGEVRRVGAALRQRWTTLRRVCECIAEFQAEFFMAGNFSASALRPLTRDEVANALGVHPSTVGRAVNDKYVELPNRRIVPLSFFFDSSAPIQALIAQLVANETTLLSDETLRRHLQRAGWPMTRRAVSLHRESMGILPTHLRRRQRRLHPGAPRALPLYLA